MTGQHAGSMVTAHPIIEYVADSAVDDALDRELRGLLSTCFTKPQDHVFKSRRFFNQPPAHRWLIRDEAGRLAAHLALHEKRLRAADGREFLVGGVAEVCVHPSSQGRGHVKQLVGAAHRWMTDAGFAFSVLSGNPRYYGSSGYRVVENLYRDGADSSGATVRVKSEGAMVVALSDQAWPEGEAHIPGPSF